MCTIIKSQSHAEYIYLFVCVCLCVCICNAVEKHLCVEFWTKRLSSLVMMYCQLLAIQRLTKNQPDYSKQH